MIALAAAGALALVGGSAAMAWPALKTVFAAPAHMQDAPVLGAPSAPQAQPVAGFVAATAAPRAPVLLPDTAAGSAASEASGDRPALLNASAGAVGVPAPAAALGLRRTDDRLPSSAGNAPPARPTQAETRAPEVEADIPQTVRPAAARPTPSRPAQAQPTAPRAQAHAARTRAPRAVAPEPAAAPQRLVHRIDPRHRWSSGELR